MPVILIEKDPFVESVINVAKSNEETARNVRRPLFGTINKSEQFSNLSVRAVDSNGATKNLVIANSSAPDGVSVRNSNYIVQNFSMAKQEKVQIVETFGDEYVFFYGERPTVIQVQGFLINTPDFNWRSEWYHNYENYLRGTKCVERKARVYLYLDGITFVGYIMTTATQIQDSQPRLTPFSFSMLVTNYFDSNIGSPSNVTKYQEARGADKGDAPEYLSKVEREPGYVTKYDLGTGALDEYVTGDQAVAFTDTSAENPESIESSDSAFWIGGPESGLRQFYKEDEAIREIAIRQYMEQNSVGRFEAVEAFNEGRTIFASASKISQSFTDSLGRGVQGSAIRV